MTLRRIAISGVCALAALASLGATPCLAQASLRDHLFGQRSDERAFVMPMVGRFRPEFGSGFVLDRSPGGQVFMRFDSSPEIWVLQPTPGPRGDVIYKNDVGDPMLRATKLGGLTLFTPTAPGGVAAAFAGQAPGLRAPPVNTAGQLLQAFTQASARASRAADRVVSFEAKDIPLAAAPVFADAATVVSEAFITVATRNNRARKSLFRFSKVEFDVGRSPDVSAKGELVRVTIAPERGLAGRPSSQRIVSAIGRR